MSKGHNKEIVDETPDDAEASAPEAEESSKSKSDKPSVEPKPKSDKGAARNDDRRGGKDKKSAKKKESSKVGRKAKDFFSELKKVTWPSFAKVLKKTGVVLVVTLCFLVVMIAFDSLLGLMYNGLISGLTDGSAAETVTAAVKLGSGFLGGGLL